MSKSSCEVLEDEYIEVAGAREKLNVVGVDAEEGHFSAAVKTKSQLKTFKQVIISKVVMRRLMTVCLMSLAWNERLETDL